VDFAFDSHSEYTHSAKRAWQSHACALLSGGTIQCWGYNVYGVLGNGTTKNPSVPIPVSGITDARAVAAGDSHTCALLSGGSVQCWGSYYSAPFNGSVSFFSLMPVTVNGF
jgi:alpha-tubulin suppressor-like RCC1 family protein